MKKALIVASVGGFIDFEKADIKRLEGLGYEVHIACARKGWERYLKGLSNKIIDISFCRNPISINNLYAFRQLKGLIRNQKYELIHCHTPIAGMITRMAARKMRRDGCTVLYTAHGFHFYKGAPVINWLLFYPVEWVCSWVTDVLITINTDDYLVAKKTMHAKKTEYVPGIGVDIESIKNKHVDTSMVRKKLGLKDNQKMILSVGELNENKNHNVVIEALAKIGDKNFQYFIAGVGVLRDELVCNAQRLGIGEQVHFLGYRDDILDLDKAADLFCFPSHREGLSVALMEAIACGTKVVCSDIRGNRDLAAGNKGVILFNQRESDSCSKAIISMVEKENCNTQLNERFGARYVHSRMLEIYRGVEQR